MHLNLHQHALIIHHTLVPTVLFVFKMKIVRRMGSGEWGIRELGSREVGSGELESRVFMFINDFFCVLSLGQGLQPSLEAFEKFYCARCDVAPFELRR